MAFEIPDLSRTDWLRFLPYILGLSLIPFFLYRWLTDPLRSIPGPFLAKCTGAWQILLELSGHRATYVHELHKKYGPVVRIGPQELVFASPQALKEIYAANSPYVKAPVYDSMGFRTTFTTRDRDEYRVMKKRILPNFNSASVKELEPIVRKQISYLIKCFDKRVGIPLDVIPWARMLALGVVGEGFAQENFGGLENEKTPELLHHIDEVFPALWFWWMFPTASKILQHGPFHGIRKFLQAANEFQKYCRTAYVNYLASHNPRDHHDLIARMVSERLTLEEKGLPLPRHITEQGVIDEVTNLIFAGTDTTGNTLTYLFWELAHYPEWQERMCDELKTVRSRDGEQEKNQQEQQQQVDFAYEDVSELPVLEAVVQEILRLRPASPAGLQRLAPEGGCVIDGVAVPAGTTISCQGLTTQRDPTIFLDPDSFNPQRWLDASSDAALEASMREQFMVFGKGARVCLGRKLALMEIKCAAAAVVHRYFVEIGAETTDDDMLIRSHFVLVPKGGRCVLKLTRA